MELDQVRKTIASNAREARPRQTLAAANRSAHSIPSFSRDVPPLGRAASGPSIDATTDQTINCATPHPTIDAAIIHYQ